MDQTIRFNFKLLLATLAASLFLTGCASPRMGEAQARMGIEQRIQEVLAAAENKDFVRLESYHLYGPKFTKFTGSSPGRLDAEAGRKGEFEGLGAITGLKTRTKDLKIDVFGDVGIATFILDFSFKAGGEIFQRQERTTLVFVKESGEWKIAHEHLSPIQP